MLSIFRNIIRNGIYKEKIMKEDNYSLKVFKNHHQISDKKTNWLDLDALGGKYEECAMSAVTSSPIDHLIKK